MNTAFVIFGAVGTGMIGYGIWSYRKPDSGNLKVTEDILQRPLPFRTKEVDGVDQTKLSKLSALWSENVIYSTFAVGKIP